MGFTGIFWSFQSNYQIVNDCVVKIIYKLKKVFVINFCGQTYIADI